MAQKTAHEEGYSAFIRCGLAARNPYRPDEKGHFGWRKGWEKARTARSTHPTGADQ